MYVNEHGPDTHVPQIVEPIIDQPDSSSTMELYYLTPGGNTLEPLHSERLCE
jgi:hypothetical protein